MQYLGSIHWFKIVMLKHSMTSNGGCHDSLSLDMSSMSLDVDCSTDDVAVDTESGHDDTQTTNSSVSSDFFTITLHSNVIIRTQSHDIVSCNHGKCVVISVLIFQPRITLDVIRGMDKHVKLLHEIVVIPLTAPDAFKRRGMSGIWPHIITTCFVVPTQALICLKEYCFME